MTPPTLKGREFESLLLDAAVREEKAGRLTMGRYGVQVAHKGTEMIAMDSLPDFEGVLAPTGSQFIIEAKVASGPSFPLQPDKIKPRQVRHMLERSRFGVVCFVVIHWTERRGKTFHDPAETIAIPVCERHSFWFAYLDECAAAKREKRNVANCGSISRDYTARIGQRVEWTCPKGSRKHLPDLAALLGISSDLPSLF